jgi:hypothetical protein
MAASVEDGFRGAAGNAVQGPITSVPLHPSLLSSPLLLSCDFESGELHL